MIYLKQFFFVLVLVILFSCNAVDKKETAVGEKATETIEVPSPKVEYFEMGELVLQKTYYENGQVRTEGNLSNDERDGKWMSWYEDGMPWSETWFKNGAKHGSTTVWYHNGRKFYEGRFENDKETGKWTYWDEEGNVLREVEY